MADFSNLKPLHISEETLAEYTFDDIPGEPSIWLAPATDANPHYQSERLRISIERAEKAEKEPRNRKRKVVLTNDDIEADRELDRDLLARCCAKKWGTPPVDAHGQTPEFTAGNCYDFFKALPNYMFDPLRNFVANPFNFVDRTGITDEQARALGND